MLRHINAVVREEVCVCVWGGGVRLSYRGSETPILLAECLVMDHSGKQRAKAEWNVV